MFIYSEIEEFSIDVSLLINFIPFQQNMQNISFPYYLPYWDKFSRGFILENEENS